MKLIDVSIIIVSYNTKKLTHECVKSILYSKTKFSYEIIVVDNNSADGTVKRLNKDFPQIEVIASSVNLGFSKANNLGIASASGQYILLLNSDTILFVDSLDSLLNAAIAKKYFITGPVLLNKDLSIQRSWFNFPSAIKIFLRLTDIYLLIYKFSNSRLFRIFSPSKKPAFMISEISEDQEMDYLSFACILIKRNVINEIGVLDEGLFFYQEDCEYGLRAKKNNYKFIYTVSSKIIHLGGSSSGKFSWMSFENDILGLLHVYKKHYPYSQFKKIKQIICVALKYRKNLSYFGFFKSVKKSGLYVKTDSNLLKNDKASYKYKELLKIVKAYN